MEQSQRKLRIWVAGSSGFSGRGITEQLAAHTHFEVLPHVRPSSRRASQLQEKWKHLDLEFILAEWDDLEPILRERQPEVIVSCLGTTKRQARQGGGGYEEVDYGLNRKLIDLAESFEQAPHFIYLSSMGSEWGRWSTYLSARMRVEQDLKDSSLSYSIIRPGILAGPSRDERRTLESLGARFSYGLSKVCDSLGLEHLGNKTRPLDAPELGRFVHKLIEQQLSRVKPRTDRKLYLVHEIHQVLRDMPR